MARQAVLVLCHADGWIEVFADRQHVDARIVMVPTAEGDDRNRDEIASEEFIERTLPHRYREVYFPLNRRAADMPRRVTFDGLARTEWEVEVLRAIQGPPPKGRKKWRA